MCKGATQPDLLKFEQVGYTAGMMPDDCITLPRLRAAMAALGKTPLAAMLQPRTLALGPFWVRFENATTLLWQLAQMAQTEGIEDDAALQAECDVYATLLPADGCLVTLGQRAPESGAWQALLAVLPSSLRLVCQDVACTASQVTPMGQTCQILFSISADMRACFADKAAVVHCQLQTFAARVPNGWCNRAL